MTSPHEVGFTINSAHDAIGSVPQPITLVPLRESAATTSYQPPLVPDSSTIDPSEAPPDNPGAPWGIDYYDLSPTQKRVWAKQAAYLTAYAVGGTRSIGAKAAGVHYMTAKWWRTNDTLGFRAREEAAMEVFADRLEQKAFDLVKDLEVRNSPLLLITLLNAHLPAKYRPTTVVVDSSVSKALLAELRRIGGGPVLALPDPQDTADG